MVGVAHYSSQEMELWFCIFVSQIMATSVAVQVELATRVAMANVDVYP